MIGSIVRVNEIGFTYWQGLRKLNPNREAWVGEIAHVCVDGTVSVDFTGVVVENYWQKYLHDCENTVPSRKGYYLQPEQFEIVDLKKITLEDLL